MARQLFISYSTADTPTTEAIRDHLEAVGIPCWMAPRQRTAIGIKLIYEPT